MSMGQISGAVSGFDWASMIESLKQVEHRRVDLVAAKKTTTASKVAAWQSFNIKLAALKSSLAALKDPDSFQLFSASLTTDNSTVPASQLLSIATSSSASPGSYSIKVNSLAQAEKISSASFSSSTDALGSAFSGGILVNGRLVNIESTDDLIDTRDKINNANTGANPSGVTATILSFSPDDIRLILTADETGSAGITLANTSANDVIGKMGFSQTGVRSNTGLNSGGTTVTGTTLIKEIDGYTDWETGDTITLTGKDIANASVNTVFTITEASTVQDLLTAIQTAYGGPAVSAVLTADGKIQVTDNSAPAASNIRVMLTPEKSSLDFGSFGTTGTIVGGADASLEIEGVAITRSSNTVDDVIQGVTLSLLKADVDTTVTLNITRNTNSIVEKINDFVSKYNDVSSFIHTQQSYDTTSNTTGGVLFGDGTLASIKADLTSAIIRQISGVNESFSILGQIGINLDNEGQLSVDNDVLSGFLKTNFSDIQALFTTTGTPVSGSLTYYSHTSAASADTSAYSVYVTSPATRSTSTSDGEIIGTLAGSETLTITEGSLSADISLTAGMTIEQVMESVNAALAAKTGVLASGNQFYSDAGHTTPITDSTTWNSLYDGGGNPAGLTNGSVISFTGTSRSGSTVSGSYQIGDAASDTVQGLLYAIEDAFDYEVDASIDASGRLLVTETDPGSSSISLAFTGLDYGTMLTSNPGGTEGRNALGVTASTNGNRLVLTSNSYGSNYGFEIAETGHLLWNADTDVNNGADISGTINGQAATGSGQNLTYNGVTVKYSGTAIDQNVGTVNLTIGLSELLDRILFNMTDPIEGYLSFKVKSLEQNITNYTNQIEDMEGLIDRRAKIMTAKFVAMEKAISTLQNQSSWLASQIENLYNFGD